MPQQYLPSPSSSSFTRAPYTPCSVAQRSTRWTGTDWSPASKISGTNCKAPTNPGPTRARHFSSMSLTKPPQPPNWVPCGPGQQSQKSHLGHRPHFRQRVRLRASPEAKKKLSRTQRTSKDLCKPQEHKPLLQAIIKATLSSSPPLSARPAQDAPETTNPLRKAILRAAFPSISQASTARGRAVNDNHHRAIAPPTPIAAKSHLGRRTHPGVQKMGIFGIKYIGHIVFRRTVWPWEIRVICPIVQLLGNYVCK